MARHKASKKVKGTRPPRQLLALRKRARRKGKLIDYHGTSIPKLPEGKHRREVMQLTRAWQEKKRKAVKVA
jgi:hypothetical protein